MKATKISHKILSNKTISFLLLILGLCLTTSCTHNNGDIGDWFGFWQLETIEVDGTADANYHSTIFWKFQNCVIEMQKISEDPDDPVRSEAFGTWEDTGDQLILDFSYSDNQNPTELGESGKGIYAPYAETRLPYGKPASLEILSSSGSRKELQYITENGERVTYYIVKR